MYVFPFYDSATMNLHMLVPSFIPTTIQFYILGVSAETANLAMTFTKIFTVDQALMFMLPTDCTGKACFTINTLIHPVADGVQ